ncbi:MAG: ribonuclease E/G, partial [Alphaproteobacteria bacterium]|nr:ribonuclease E/G [Alphaproteobacteria bacterium]
ILIDASHLEETRVAVLSGTQVEEFDFESVNKRRLRGNIYLGQITRVEPSLQAAFVEYGGNRQGFLAFNEIHPDYYQIPKADREALLREHIMTDTEATDLEETAAPPEKDREKDIEKDKEAGKETDKDKELDKATDKETELDANGETNGKEYESANTVEDIGEDAQEEASTSAWRKAFVEKYKIQEVIKRRQVILVQVVKEERGNKGAALTSFLSLAGRYCVFMPNTARGGGISRKILSLAERRHLKKIVSALNLDDGRGLIIRTAGAQRTATEIKRDYQYLTNTWEKISKLTLESTAPALIHEEGTLIKRVIRDLYDKDFDEILVQGEDGYKTARNYMKSFIPSHARKVKLYKGTTPLYQESGIEEQLASMFNPVVPLPSGGYLVINQTEALVAIDVNSGKATKEHSIEQTAQKTNLEAVQEAARQMRLRDLAGLLVIDLIDMTEPRHNRAVERKLKEALKHDRARIRVGRISPFGLLEMSRQRMRASVLEGSSVRCEHCNGTGLVRSVESRVLQILRVIEEEADKIQQQKTQAPMEEQEIIVSMLPDAAEYMLNQKRTHLIAIEDKINSPIRIKRDSTLTAQQITISNKNGKTKLVRMDGDLDMDMPQSKAENRGRRRRGRRGGRRRKADNAKADNVKADSTQSAKLPNMPELQIEPPTEPQAEKKAKKATPKKQRTKTAKSQIKDKAKNKAKDKAKQTAPKPIGTENAPLIIKPKDKKKTPPKKAKKPENIK